MATTTKHIPVALTIAGSDSGGGAGIQADLRTFAALRVFGTSAITAITAQNTCGVSGIVTLSTDIIAQQIDAVLSDFAVGAIKTGMLSSAAVVECVVATCKRAPHLPPMVVDPVMVAKSGHALLDDDAVNSVRTLLLPCATVVMPNLPEAERLWGRRITTLDQQRDAARALCDLGARSAIIKGGHSTFSSVDILWDGSHFHEIAVHKIDTQNTHGTGCTFASAVAALLARGHALPQAFVEAQAYVQQAIRTAPALGHGHGPLHHMHPHYAFAAEQT